MEERSSKKSPVAMHQDERIIEEIKSRRDKSPSEEGEEREEDKQETEGEETKGQEIDDTSPPLPDEAPPLPFEPPPSKINKEITHDDGWEARADPTSGAWYFYNKFTGISQWDNPRVPTSSSHTSSKKGMKAPGTEETDTTTADVTNTEPPGLYMGYNPAIHGDYDPNADYAQYHQPNKGSTDPNTDPDAIIPDTTTDYTQEATFNRFTGKFQSDNKTTEYFNDENKSKRQMNAFFDVDRAANTHQGKSLKAQRSGQKLTKEDVKEYNSKRRAKKEQRRREFLLS